ncbi:TPA: restriction endonuclease, partial [Klebsiella pneumoniae]|nr:restriction endonuclease [Klebsiella pneumoniae]
MGMSYFEPVLFSDPKEFERYVCEYFSILYDTRFSTYGTPGQNQNGIDGLHFGPSNDGKKHVIQCKNLNYSDLTLQIIQDDINKAKELKVEFDVFHFVTSAK